MNNFKFSKSSLEKLNGIHVILRETCMYALPLCEIDFGVTWGYRTPEQQRKVYDDGFSNCDGTEILSPHQKQLAVDLHPAVKYQGVTDYRDETMLKIAEAMRLGFLKINPPDYRLMWGMRWSFLTEKQTAQRMYDEIAVPKFKDVPHFELVKMKKTCETTN